VHPPAVENATRSVPVVYKDLEKENVLFRGINTIYPPNVNRFRGFRGGGKPN